MHVAKTNDTNHETTPNAAEYFFNILSALLSDQGQLLTEFST